MTLKRLLTHSFASTVPAYHMPFPVPLLCMQQHEKRADVSCLGTCIIIKDTPPTSMHRSALAALITRLGALHDDDTDAADSPPDAAPAADTAPADDVTEEPVPSLADEIGKLSLQELGRYIPSLAEVIEKVPPEELAKCIPPTLFERLRQTGKTTLDLLDDHGIPREFRKNKLWWLASRGPPEEKTRVILNELSVRVDECWTKNTPLASIVLTDCNLNDLDDSRRMLLALSHCPSLSRLDLSGSHINCDVFPLREACILTSLAHLDLNHCELDLSALAQILQQWQCQDLAFLDLSHNTDIRDNVHTNPPIVFPRRYHHATLLTQVPRLTHLNLASNYIGDDQARALTSFLMSNTCLTHLDLSLNNMSYFGAWSVADALSTSSVLTHLNLSSIRIRPDGFHLVTEELVKIPNLTHLSLAYCGLCSPWGGTRTGPSNLAHMLQRCTALQSIDLESNNILPDGARALAAVLPTCSALQDLNLNRNDLHFQGLTCLAPVLPRCVSLRTLSLNSNDLQLLGELLDNLPACTSLTHLELAYNGLASETACELANIMQQCTALCSLNLQGNRVEASAAHTLVDALVARKSPSPFTLNLKYNTFWNDDATHDRLAQKCAGTNVLVESRRPPAR